MGETSVKLSIILVSFNTREITCQCLKSLYAAEWDFPFEIIMVDNNSHDDTLEYVRRDFPEVKIIANEDNKLFAIANNQGAAIANGEYLLLLNTDTIAEGDNLCRLVHYMEGLPEKVVCVGPKILNADGSLQSEGRTQRGWGPRIVNNLKLHHFLPDSLILRMLPAGTPVRKSIARRVGWLLGCCMLMRASYYLASGGLNEKLVFYGEETEFSYRAGKAKKELWYYPDASIIHFGGLSTNRDWADSIKLDSEITLCRLTSGLPLAIFEWVIICVVNGVKVLFTFSSKYWQKLKYSSWIVHQFMKNLKLSDFIPGKNRYKL